VATCAATDGQRPVTTEREATATINQGARSEGSIAPTRMQRRRQQCIRQVAVLTDCSRTRDRPAPGIYSLPIRIDRDTLAAQNIIGIRVLGGFLNIFEVPSSSYYQAMEQPTRVRNLRPAGMSDSETEDTQIERSLMAQNYCTMCGQGMEDYCQVCNVIRDRFPDFS